LLQFALRGGAQVGQRGADQLSAVLQQHPRRVTIMAAAGWHAQAPLVEHRIDHDVQRHRRAQQFLVDVGVQRGPGGHDAGLSTPPSAPRRRTAPESP